MSEVIFLIDVGVMGVPIKGNRFPGAIENCYNL